MKLLLATRNAGKITEIKNKLSGIRDLEILTPDNFDNLPDVAETGETFMDNALLKARALADATGFAALSDDSGLVVDGLDGRPGVFSARYGGPGLSDEDRNRLLLKEMEGIQNRSARFVCAIAIVLPDGRSLTAEGSCEGLITDSPSGSSGFGYDPVFFLPEMKKTMAGLSVAEKNRISHRARALDQAARLLASLNSL